MKYNRYQYGGKSACDDVMNNFNLCDILNSAIRVIIENIVEKPINAIIDIVNNYIGQMNNFIWLILTFVACISHVFLMYFIFRIQCILHVFYCFFI